MIKVSVIIPMYNAAMHIEKCLDSIAAQSLSEMEIIIVDDKSTDESVTITENYIAQGKCGVEIRLIKQQVNQGPGIARNAGIAHAKGDYIAFLDSDDWIEQNTYSILYEEATKYDADLCYCNAVMDFPNGETQNIMSYKTASGAFQGKEKRQFLTHFVTYCVTYIYKRAFLIQNEITFPTGRSAEDSVFLTKCILNCMRIASVNNIFYHYVINQTSLKQCINPSRYKDKLFNFSLIVAEKHKHENYQSELEYIYIKKGVILSAMSYIVDSKKPDESVIKEMFSALKTQVPTYAENEYYKQDYKCRILLTCLSKSARIFVNLLKFLFWSFPQKKAIV